MSSFTRCLVVSLLVICASSTEVVGQQPLGVNPTNGREKDPVFRSDGQELFFTRVDHPSNKGTDNAGDIWTRIRYPDGSWGRALNPGTPINSFAHDRALALSADGTRLAVLRNGITNYIELLERNERNWRIIATWPLPEGVSPRFDLTFDLNSQRVIYSAYGGVGKLDMYERTALANGQWSSSKPLTLLNGADNETQPHMAADGRSLYFRSGDEWMLQEQQGSVARQVDLPTRMQQVAPATNQAEAVITYNDLGQDERLMVQPLPTSALPPPGKMVRGYLSVPPAPGERTAIVPLTNGDKLSVWPDPLQRYAVFLRTGEALVKNAGGASANAEEFGSAAGYADTTGGPVTTSTDRLRLEAGIASRERALQQLDAERKKYDLAAPKVTDPELDALRDRWQRNEGNGVDTIPKGTTAKGGSVKDRYAADLADLERMKAKFRKQQEEKLRQRSGYSHQWTNKEATPATATPTPAANVAIPSIRDSYTPAIRVDAAAAARQAYTDSLRLAAEVRSGLYPNQQSKAYERESWENDLRQTLPQTTLLSPEEITRLDDEYQRQQGELAALKAELQRLNQTTPTTAPATNPNWTAKGTPQTETGLVPRRQQPAAYGSQPAAYVPAIPPRATVPATGNRVGIAAGISFIPNTAYPDGAGYTGLDQLVLQLKNTKIRLEIRVHTSIEFDRRIAQLLSEERATSIREHLMEEGVSTNLFTVIGFGNNLTGSGGERVEIVR